MKQRLGDFADRKKDGIDGDHRSARGQAGVELPGGEWIAGHLAIDDGVVEAVEAVTGIVVGTERVVWKVGHAGVGTRELHGFAGAGRGGRRGDSKPVDRAIGEQEYQEEDDQMW